MTTALSTGCFIGHEDRILAAQLDAVELSSHRPEQLGNVLAALEAAGTRILSLHTPCPNSGRGLDPGGAGEAWEFTRASLLESGLIARKVAAQYVLAHAFYCSTGPLPSGDAERMARLREAGDGQESFADYVRSEVYQEAKQRTITNLKTLIPEWRKHFPEQAIILENLNPRHGYGGVVFQDVLDIALALDGEVKICLDVGHLTLAERALGVEMSASVAAARDLIVSVHVHQNFGGRYCIDRHFSDAAPRGSLQDVDTHLPLDVPMWLPQGAPRLAVGAENSAFRDELQFAAQHAHSPGAEAVVGAVDVDYWLGLVPAQANLILELDARYVPLAQVLENYERFRVRQVAAE